MEHKKAIAGAVIRHAGVLAGCVFFVLPLYGLGIFSGAVSIEVTGADTPGIGVIFMLLLPFTFSPPVLVILASLIIPGTTQRSVIPNIIVTKGLFVLLGIVAVIVGPFIGFVIYWFFTDFNSAGIYFLSLLVPYLLGIVSILGGIEVYRQPEESQDH